MKPSSEPSVLLEILQALKVDNYIMSQCVPGFLDPFLAKDLSGVLTLQAAVRDFSLQDTHSLYKSLYIRGTQTFSACKLLLK